MSLRCLFSSTTASSYISIVWVLLFAFRTFRAFLTSRSSSRSDINGFAIITTLLRVYTTYHYCNTCQKWLLYVEVPFKSVQMLFNKLARTTLVRSEDAADQRKSPASCAERQCF